MRTILGSVSAQVGSLSNFELLSEAVVSTATSSAIFFDQYISRWRQFLVVLKDVEKPNTFASIWTAVISTNGATFESAIGYVWSLSGCGATTTFASTGVTGAATDTKIVLGGGCAAFSSVGALATATGRSPGRFEVLITNQGATGRGLVQWNLDFTNSASSPVQQQGAGWFASGPAVGIDIGAGGVAFSANMELWGVGRK